MDGSFEVPDRLVGCWRREFIRFDDGTVDDSSDVIWLQTRSAMADLRLGGRRRDLARLTSLADCSSQDLIVLATSDSSSGYTLLDEDDLATWHTGDEGVDFQPVSAFPEPGKLTWSQDGTVMFEHAPSGAYDEAWRRLPGSDGPSGHVVVDGAVREAWYVVGEHAMYVRGRKSPPPDDRRIDQVVADLLSAPVTDRRRAAAEALVDCEFSYACRHAGRWVITLSTLPWRQGTTLDMSRLSAVIGGNTS